MNWPFSLFLSTDSEISDADFPTRPSAKSNSHESGSADDSEDGSDDSKGDTDNSDDDGDGDEGGNGTTNAHPGPSVAAGGTNLEEMGREDSVDGTSPAVPWMSSILD